LKTIAIIGAGAAGTFAAANLPKSDAYRVLLFEKTGKALQKVRASGGGRCNVTHQLFDIPELIERYPRGPRWLKKTLHRFGPQQTIDWFEKRGVSIVGEADGRMFPETNSAETIAMAIWETALQNGTEVRFHHKLEALQRVGEQWALTFGGHEPVLADAVLITTGGSPQLSGFNLLQTLGHTIASPVPSLFTFNMPGNPIITLMGVSVPEAIVRISGTKIETSGPLLITHWGMSGPAILRASAWGARELADRAYQFTISINWVPGMDEASLKARLVQLRQQDGRQPVGGKNPFDLPKRLWQFFLHTCGVAEDATWATLEAAPQRKLLEKLIRDSYTVSGKTTFKEEFVTCGGVSLKEVSPETLESRLHPGIYFAGEVLDVDGITGGFNFQHAWASGWLAAAAMAATSSSS
jgi:predicted Rossmann fold flavoprotein